MSNQRGYVRIERAIRDLPFWPKGRRYSQIEALLDLKMNARIKDETVDRGGVDIHVPAGSFLTDQMRLAERWGWDRKTVRKFLDRLVSRRLCLIFTKRGVDKGYTLITFIEDTGFSGEENSNSPMMNRENSPSDSPSDPHKVNLDNTETVGMVGMYANDSAPERVRDELMEAARVGDYWAFSTGIRESKLLMNLKPSELEPIAKIKSVFGQSAVVVSVSHQDVNNSAPGEKSQKVRVLKELLRLGVPDHEAIELAKRGCAAEIDKVLRTAQRRAALAIPSSMRTMTGS